MTGNKFCNRTFYRYPMHTRIVFVTCYLLCAWLGKLANGQSIDVEIGNITVYVGQSATLTCNLNGIGGKDIYWYHKEFRYFLSYQEAIQGPFPGGLENRLSVVCNRSQESCSLTVSNVMLEDKGTYVCGYRYFFGLFRRKLTEGYLDVIVLPPSENSPFCSILGTEYDNGRPSKPTALSQTFSVGETILLKCLVNGTTTPPTLIWNRLDLNLTSQIMTNVSEMIHVLSENDFEVEFTCLMTHPAIQELRNCSVIPLPLPKTTTSKPTTTLATEIISIRTNQIMMKTQEIILKSSTNVVLYVLLPCATVTIGLLLLLGFFLLCKNSKSMPIPPDQRNQNPTATACQGAPADYIELAARSEEHVKYEDLQTTSADNTAAENEYTYPNVTAISGDCEVAAVSDQYESIEGIAHSPKINSENAEKATENVHFALYENLQRPVKAETLNA